MVTPFLLQTDGSAQVKSQWFMLALMISQRTYMEELTITPPPTGKSQADVVVDYLSKLREAIYLVLRSSFDMDEIRIQWWFAIPPVWDGTGEASLRASALLAGFIRGDHDDEIFFIPEPVAYVLYCCKTQLFNPQPSHAFLAVVASRATVELATYEATSGRPLVLKQLTTPSGDFCG